MPTNKQEIGLYPENCQNDCLKRAVNSQRKRNLYESGGNLGLKILFSYNKSKFHSRCETLCSLLEEKKLKLKNGGCNEVELTVLYSIGVKAVKAAGAGLGYLQKSFTEHLDLGETNSRAVLVFAV